jgi:hypothetical protein
VILGLDDLLDALNDIHGFPIVPHRGKEGILFELLLSRAYFSRLADSNEGNPEGREALNALLEKMDGIIKYQPSLQHSVDHDDIRKFQEEFRGKISDAIQFADHLRSDINGSKLRIR